MSQISMNEALVTLMTTLLMCLRLEAAAAARQSLDVLGNNCGVL
jgi:hypothetical protein